MRTDTGPETIRLTVRAFMLAYALIVSPARGAERLGSVVWDVGRIPPKAAEASVTYLGVYGDVLVQPNGGVISRDQAYPEKSIPLDIRRLAQVDRQRLRSQCARNACSEITMGFIVHGVLQATSSEPFRSANSWPITSALSGSRLTEASRPAGWANRGGTDHAR